LFFSSSFPSSLGGSTHSGPKGPGSRGRVALFQLRRPLVCHCSRAVSSLTRTNHPSTILAGMPPRSAGTSKPEHANATRTRQSPPSGDNRGPLIPRSLRRVPLVACPPVLSEQSGLSPCMKRTPPQADECRPRRGHGLLPRVKRRPPQADERNPWKTPPPTSSSPRRGEGKVPSRPQVCHRSRAASSLGQTDHPSTILARMSPRRELWTRPHPNTQILPEPANLHHLATTAAP
jgi:hypothetical protein